MDVPILFSRTSPFSILGVLVVFLSFFYRTYYKQTVKILIWVCAVCLSMSHKMTLGLYGLTIVIFHNKRGKNRTNNHWPLGWHFILSRRISVLQRPSSGFLATEVQITVQLMSCDFNNAMWSYCSNNKLLYLISFLFSRWCFWRRFRCFYTINRSDNSNNSGCDCYSCVSCYHHHLLLL